MTDTLIGRGLKIEGTVRGSGSLIVEGEVLGNIAMEKDVMVRETGRVNADIQADNVNVSGTVNGAIRAGGFVHITKESRVMGDIIGPSINIERGARFSGNLRMGDPEDALERA